MERLNLILSGGGYLEYKVREEDESLVPIEDERVEGGKEYYERNIVKQVERWCIKI